MSSLTTAGSSMDEGVFDTRLSLEIGETSRRAPPPPQSNKATTAVRLFGEMISPQGHGGGDDHPAEPTRTPAAAGRKKRAAESGGAAIASKKARTATSSSQAQQKQEDDDDVGNNNRWSPSDGGGGGSASRKKLRLTGAQATMLEDSFRTHNILSHAQKQELARRVGLSARQVEVWFQNRRARTKLKQTEVDCDLLRRWCDRLTDENARLRRDLADLRAAAVSVVVCPSCCHKKMATMVAGDVA